MATPEGKVDRPEAAPAPSRESALLFRSARVRRSPVVSGLARLAEHPQAILAAFVVVAAALSLWETRGQIYFSDEWHRLTFDADSLDPLLRGYSGHLVVLQTLLYRAVFDLFGASSYLPFRIIEALLLAACGSLFYALARTRAEPWRCLAATVVLLFLGSASEVAATPYGIVVLLPMALGLAALLVLVRLPGDGDPLACLLLVAAVASQSMGLPFLAGAAVILLRGEKRARASRLWVVLIPAALYAAWFAWYRITATAANPDQVQLHNIGEIPSMIAGASAAGLAAISGLSGTSASTGGLGFNLEAGYMLLGLLVVAAVWRIRTGPAIDRWIWVPLVLGLTFWALLGMVAGPGRGPTASRYLYPSAVFLLLILLELTRGIRTTPRVLLAAATALVISLVPNLINLNQAAGNFRASASTERAELGALEVLRDEIPAGSMPDLTIANGVISVGGPGNAIPAEDYFAAVDRYGSPALSPAQLAAGDPDQRQIADQVLLREGDLDLARPSRSEMAGAGSCRSVFGAHVGSGRSFAVPDDGLLVRPRGSRPLTTAARRFATGFQALRAPRGLQTLLLEPASPGETPPWMVLIRGASVCRTS